MYLKVIACEIAVREICHALARSPHVIDPEFLTQGHHDHPNLGRVEIQKRLDAVPAGKFDAILVGYGMCGSILNGLVAPSTRLVVPRAHDCITFFLGSKERYQRCFTERPGTYYFTSGWLECRTRRGELSLSGRGSFMPAQTAAGMEASYQEWVTRFGEEQAKYLSEVMTEWSQHYTHGSLIDYDFSRPLKLADEVRRICTEKGWQFEDLPGDLGLLQRWLDGEWSEAEFLVAQPGQKIVPSYNEGIIACVPATET